MIDDPKQYDQKKLESYIQNVPEKYNENPLSYFTMMLTEFIVSKSPDVEKVIVKLSKSKNGVNRFIAYSSLAKLGRTNKRENDFFEQFLPIIESNIQKEDNNVKEAMNNSLLFWGQRSKELSVKILNSFKEIGDVIVDYGTTFWQTPNVLQILSSDRIKDKLI